MIFSRKTVRSFCINDIFFLEIDDNDYVDCEDDDDNYDDYPYVLYNLNPPRSFCIDDILSHKTAALQRGGPPSMQGSGGEDDDDFDENDDDYEEEEYGGDNVDGGVIGLT